MARLVIRQGDGLVTKRLTKLEFATRVGFAHEAALDELQSHPDCPRSVAATIRTMLRWMDRPEEASGTWVGDPRTIQLVDAALGLLSTAALMTLVGRTAYTTAEADALRAVWLDPEGPEPVETFEPPLRVIG